MKLERKIIGRREPNITSLLEPRLEFGLLLLVICAVVVGLIVKKPQNWCNWRRWRSRWRPQESFEMSGIGRNSTEETNERRESRERERRRETENLEMRVGLLEREKERLGDQISRSIASFEGKIMMIESNIKALRDEFLLREITN